MAIEISPEEFRQTVHSTSSTWTRSPDDPSLSARGEADLLAAIERGTVRTRERMASDTKWLQ